MELSALHELIGKKLAGELSTPEHEVLEAWLAQATAEEQFVYEETIRYWQTPVPPAVSAEDTAAALHRLLAQLDDSATTEHVPQASSRRHVLLTPVAPAPWWRTRVAAAVAALVVAGSAAVGFWRYHHSVNGTDIPLAFEEMTTARGATSKVLLADGTAVWLNADSHLWFPRSFRGGQREVYLDGEAFFDVKPNRQQPFIIHLGQEQVRVLGTSFNIKAYHEDETMETAVVTGKVAFIRAGTESATSPDTVYAVPNQRVVYSKKTEALRRETVNSQDYATWSRGGFVFQATSLADVARALERHYNVQVQFANEELRRCQLTGRFRDQSLREVVSILSLTGTFGFELTNERLLITGPGCAPAALAAPAVHAL
ncbi:DUF4974 domain-containing protein [Hymenobacter sp. HSC-4F20]|uniref:FecR family protein n=1 Tax=Hymenobacter sp. HSC-4F20 TaxID=2864135 RepID=UPI001C736529|nr:FecR domain-containing protein [Hymenobacter sp. HSC-4F20]MBX0291934.1 DUF4974 domain-containing protein [Hymenobacter sp. HSC-4F20]